MPGRGPQLGRRPQRSKKAMQQICNRSARDGSPTPTSKVRHASLLLSVDSPQWSLPFPDSRLLLPQACATLRQFGSGPFGGTGTQVQTAKVSVEPTSLSS